MAAILFKWLVTPMMFFLHPFYVGVTEMQHNSTDHTLEISIKLFIEDFETSLNKNGSTTVDLAAPRDPAKANQLVADYIRQHFQIKLNGKPVKLEFVGYEKEKEAAWCYFQVNNVNEVSKLEVSNSLLYDSFDKQINLIHVTVNGQRKSTKLSYPDDKTVFEF
jgi:hypothetical protein